METAVPNLACPLTPCRVGQEVGAMRTTTIESRNGEKIGWLIGALLMGIAIAFGAAVSADETSVHYPQPESPGPAASVVAAARQADSQPTVSPSVRAHRITYVVVDSPDAAAALQTFVGVNRAMMQQALGEAQVVVVTTPEQDEVLRDLIASANLELMASGAFIEMIDLRSP